MLQHDYCYDTCGTGRDKCDTDFHMCMTELCADRHGSAEECVKAAGMYSGGVKMLGCDIYKTSQKQACVCAEEGREKQGRSPRPEGAAEGNAGSEVDGPDGRYCGNHSAGGMFSIMAEVTFSPAERTADFYVAYDSKDHKPFVQPCKGVAYEYPSGEKPTKGKVLGGVECYDELGVKEAGFHYVPKFDSVTASVKGIPLIGSASVRLNKKGCPAEPYGGKEEL